LLIEYRGHKGKINVEYLQWTSELAGLFLEGGKDLGYKVGDLNTELNSGLYFFLKIQIRLKFNFPLKQALV
jgi:hypothetical protein